MNLLLKIENCPDEIIWKRLIDICHSSANDISKLTPSSSITGQFADGTSYKISVENSSNNIQTFYYKAKKGFGMQSGNVLAFSITEAACKICDIVGCKESDIIKLST